MKLVIIVQCHKLTDALEYSIGKLKNRIDVFVIIHVDKKSILDEFRHLESPNVILLPFRELVNWGSFGQIRSTLNAFEWLQHQYIEFDYVSLISGDDVLLRPVEVFLKFLDNNRGTEFIGVEKNGGHFYDPTDRVFYKYPKFFFSKEMNFRKKISLLLFKFSVLLGFHRNRRFSDLPTPYKGSSWFTVTNEAMMYILDFLEANKNYEVSFLNSFCADEVFFQTLLMNSPHKHSINLIDCSDIDDNEASLRYIDWQSGPDYPKILDVDDLKYAKGKLLFFARKVSSNVSLSDLHKVLD
jgi:hypothetical protein